MYAIVAQTSNNFQISAFRIVVHILCFQRSEEHTSELQSRLHLVCRLLLEKKKKRLFDRAKDRGLGRVIVVNRIDAEEVDLAAVLAHLRDGFCKECLPVNLPAGKGKAVVDC